MAHITRHPLLAFSLVLLCIALANAFAVRPGKRVLSGTEASLPLPGRGVGLRSFGQSSASDVIGRNQVKAKDLRRRWNAFNGPTRRSTAPRSDPSPGSPKYPNGAIGYVVAVSPSGAISVVCDESDVYAVCGTAADSTGTPLMVQIDSPSGGTGVPGATFALAVTSSVSTGDAVNLNGFSRYAEYDLGPSPDVSDIWSIDQTSGQLTVSGDYFSVQTEGSADIGSLGAWQDDVNVGSTTVVLQFAYTLPQPVGGPYTNGEIGGLYVVYASGATLPICDEPTVYAVCYSGDDLDHVPLTVSIQSSGGGVFGGLASPFALRVTSSATTGAYIDLIAPVDPADYNLGPGGMSNIWNIDQTTGSLTAAKPVTFAVLGPGHNAGDVVAFGSGDTVASGDTVVGIRFVPS